MKSKKIKSAPKINEPEIEAIFEELLYPTRAQLEATAKEMIEAEEKLKNLQLKFHEQQNNFRNRKLGRLPAHPGSVEGYSLQQLAHNLWTLQQKK